MGIVDSFKSFVHSITTEDHYASYDSPYKNSAINNVGTTVGGGNSSSRLHELNRLATANSSSHSLIEGGNNANGSRTSLSRNGSSTTVGYRPGLRSSNTNSSDLQLQNLNASGQPPLPSIDSLWDRIESWLEEEYPELGDNLNDGVTTADLNEFENDLGCGSLPVEVRQFYKRHDGQFRGGKPTGMIMGLTLLDLEGIVEEYAIWAKVNQRLEKQQYIFQHQQQQSQKATSSAASEAQGNQSRINNSFIANQKSIPPNAIQPYYAHRGWIPFVKDFCGNQIAIDLAPGPQGHWGQIIIFGRDYDTKLVIASNLQEFIFGFVSDLELGNFQIDQNDQDSGFLDGSRNDDDYMIGDGQEDQGELCFIDKDKKEFGTSMKGKLTYLEVLKRRALKKFGITNLDKFSTSFTPQRIAHTRPNASGASSPVRAASPSISGTTANANKSQNPLINMESSSKVALPKETLIDEEKKLPEEPVKKPEVESIKEEVAQPEEQIKQNDDIVEEKPEAVETSAREEDNKEEKEQEKEQENEEDKEDAPEEEENKDTKPLTKSQKKNQNKKAKKQQQKQKQNETDGVEEVAEDLNDVAL
ncbi:KNR4/SMI1-like protein 2 [Debaryomyces fabryi]|uniref:KNR4/SMI1-like protein 2 n=1 Tax=Debaryomyces fabryi TaxID=58627 RepID=A0A0V1PSW5_9ASCO|nr:KNR4/SMI1-like protein 2 [Debaryomyces fabryi]KRZ99320.1 KNR4/SMI1-like protein 2 [Debaryomyces fabryi]CUM53201.1 unnamed protein product [Debaryomyces fabryi]